MRIFTSYSVEEIFLPRYMNWSTNFRVLTFNEEIMSLGFKHKKWVTSAVRKCSRYSNQSRRSKTLNSHLHIPLKKLTLCFFLHEMDVLGKPNSINWLINWLFLTVCQPVRAILCLETRTSFSYSHLYLVLSEGLVFVLGVFFFSFLHKVLSKTNKFQADQFDS